MNDLVSDMYNFVAISGAFLAVLVMQLAEQDRINRIDSVPLQWLRRAALTSIALAACYSVLYQDWTPTLPVLAMVAAGSFALAVNAIALSTRAPPKGRRASVARVRDFFRRI